MDKPKEDSPMSQRAYKYIIIGTGLAGCYAVEGIRGVDKEGSILLIGNEQHLPYDRPPLTKKLWLGKKKVDEIFVRDQKYYQDNGVCVQVNTTAIQVNASDKTLVCSDGTFYSYDKLLLATGGLPKRLAIEGSGLDEIYYYRYLDDFLHLKSHIRPGLRVMVIGGGFIGAELAAALSINQVQVTVLERGMHLGERIFPPSLSARIQEDYIRRGVAVLTDDEPVSIIRRGRNLLTRTRGGNDITSEIIIVGIGIEPETKLARSAGLAVGDGIIVDERLQTSSPDIFAAGDNACFPYPALGRTMRVEHWDNAINQGRTAGMNMAGANVEYTHMPYFFSDLFDFGYEAVGLVSSRLEMHADWQKEDDTGVIYYVEDDRVVGVMLCNLWNKVDAARELIRSHAAIGNAQLQQPQ
jgi:3-phenylpropionate/trans-cinnamate dioxygenase ferredoxin reductase component